MTQEYGLGRNETPFDSRDWTPATLKAMVKLGVVHPMKWTAPAFLNQGRRRIAWVSPGPPSSPQPGRRQA